MVIVFSEINVALLIIYYTQSLSAFETILDSVINVFYAIDIFTK